MINILLVSIAIVLYSKCSEKINNTKIMQVIGLYIASQILVVGDLFYEKDILFLLCTILYIILIQKILFKYQSKVSFGIYTIIYLFTILVTPIVYKDVVSYQIGLNSPLFANLITLLLVLILGYINVLENNKYRNIFAAVLLVICILNGLVYNSFYLATISNNNSILIETCNQLTEITNNHYYELSNDIDCNNNEIKSKGRIVPYKIHINGKGHSISNLQLITNNTRINGQSEITNIRFDNLEIDGNGLVAINYGAIKQVATTNSTIKGSENVGGLIGTNYGSISDSYSSANTIEGKSNIGGITGANFGEIENVYSTSFVDGYEYIGGLIGKQSKPGYIQNSFYDDRFVTEETISKGALVIIGQNRKTMEVIDKFKNIEKTKASQTEAYEALSKDDKNIINNALHSNMFSWYFGESRNNVIVLERIGYQRYLKYSETGLLSNVTYKSKKRFPLFQLGSYKDKNSSIILDAKIVKGQPPKYFDNQQPGIYSSLRSYYFNSQIWDFGTVDSNNVNPLKLKEEQRSEKLSANIEN